MTTQTPATEQRLNDAEIRASTLNDEYNNAREALNKAREAVTKGDTNITAVDLAQQKDALDHLLLTLEHAGTEYDQALTEHTAWEASQLRHPLTDLPTLEEEATKALRSAEVALHEFIAALNNRNAIIERSWRSTRNLIGTNEVAGISAPELDSAASSFTLELDGQAIRQVGAGAYLAALFNTYSRKPNKLGISGTISADTWISETPTTAEQVHDELSKRLNG